MRQIGTIADEDGARAFAAYLLTQGITTRIDPPTAEGCALWVHKEDLLSHARRELASFQEDPQNSRYLQAIRAAEAIRRQRAQEDRRHARNSIDLRGRLGHPMARGGPVTRVLVLLSVALFLLLWLVPPDLGFRIRNALLFSPLIFVDGQFASPGLRPILSGQLWRLVTPIFLHFGPLHIIFNMIMLSRLGQVIELRWGGMKFLALVLVVALASNAAQYAFPNAFTVPGFRVAGGPGAFGGMSGVVYGLFGYIWIRGRLDPSSGLVLLPDAVTIMLVWLVVCAFNLVGPIANTAHVVGLLAGAFVAFLEVQTLRRAP